MRREVVAMAAVIAIAACAPIAPRSDADDELSAPLPEAADGDLFAYRPDVDKLSIGDPVPATRFIDARGQPLELRELTGRVVVLTFVTSPDGTFDPPEPLTRLIAISAQLGDRLAATTTFVALLIDDAPDADRRLRELAALMPDDGHDWRFLRAGAESTGGLTAALGVVVWRQAGAVRHTLATVVIDTEGRYADRFPGLDEWAAIDVVAAVAAAAGR